MIKNHQRLVVLWTGGSPSGKPDSVRIVLSGSQGFPEQLAGDRSSRVTFDPECSGFIGGTEGREFLIGLSFDIHADQLRTLRSLGQGASDALDAIAMRAFHGSKSVDTSVPEILTDEERRLGVEFDSLDSFSHGLASPDPDELERQIAFIRENFPGHVAAIGCAAQAAREWVLSNADEIRARAQATAAEVSRGADRWLLQLFGGS